MSFIWRTTCHSDRNDGVASIGNRVDRCYGYVPTRLCLLSDSFVIRSINLTPIRRFIWRVSNRILWSILGVQRKIACQPSQTSSTLGRARHTPFAENSFNLVNEGDSIYESVPSEGPEVVGESALFADGLSYQQRQQGTTSTPSTNRQGAHTSDRLGGIQGALRYRNSDFRSPDPTPGTLSFSPPGPAHSSLPSNEWDEVSMYLLGTINAIHGYLRQRDGLNQVIDGFLLIHKSFVRARSGRSNQHDCPPDALFITKLAKDVGLSSTFVFSSIVASNGV